MNAAGLAMIEAESLDQVKGLCVYPMISDEYRNAFEAMTREVFTGASRTMEFKMIGLKGRPLWLYTNAVPLRDEQGAVVAVLSITTDITERKEAERQLAESQRMLRNVIDSIPVRVFWKDLDSRYLGCNNLFAQDAGRPGPDSLLGQDDFAMAWAEQAELYRADDREVMRTGIPKINYEEPQTTPAGDRIWLRTSKIPLRDENGAVYGVLGTYEDITERKRIEEALQRSEKMLQTIIDTEPDCIKLTDRESRVLMMNRAGLAMVEADSLEQVQGQVICPLVAPRHRDAFLALTEQVFRGGTGTLEFQMTSMRGRQLWLETRAVPLRNEKDEIVALLGVTRDITHRMQAERALRESEERFRDLAETLPLTIFELDLQGRITYVNRAALEKFGYTQQDVEAGVNVMEVVAPRDRDRAREDMGRRISGGGPLTSEYLALRKDGTTFPVAVASNPNVQDGRPAGLRGIVMDLTERKALEEERVKTEKLESIGTLAGGIAHDFNNLLQGVFGYISMAKLSIDQRERSLAMLEQAEKALHLSVNLTSQLLTFSKGGKPVKKRVSLFPLIEDAAKFALSGSRSEYRFESETGLWQVDADAGQLAQVIQNIVLNADQAMPLGGTVLITARNMTASDPVLPSGLEKRDHVAISIRDSGIGIPAEYVGRIFDPYFTTKEKGSGLGLATSYSIIRNHEGWITVNSDVGKGTVFTICLPAVKSATDQTDRAVRQVPMRRGRILVMDDEEVVRTVAGELIQALGHEAVFAENGEEALTAYRDAQASGRPFDVVILDLTIRGGMGGAETFLKLREIDPQAKAIVSSGYSEDSIVTNHEKHGFSAFLKKPYALTELRDTLAGLLAER